MPEAIPAPGKGATQVAPSCYKCGAALEPDAAGVCPTCGRRQTRQCFCGTKISRGPVVCPTCEADWSRIRRRSRRSREPVSTQALLLNASIGGVGALLVAGLLYFLVMGGAQSLAEATLSAASSLWPVVSHFASRAAAPVAVFLAGCLFGVGRYYLSVGSRNRGRGKQRPRGRSEER